MKPKPPRPRLVGPCGRPRSRTGDDGTWKIAQRVAKDRVISVVDPETRHMHKSRSEYRDGYKAHIAIEPETGLVTSATLTPANAPDGSTGVELIRDEEPGLQILGDGAYGSGEMLAALSAARHHKALKPWPLNTAVPGGFSATTSLSTTKPRRPPARPGTPSSSQGIRRRVRHPLSRLSTASRCTKARDGRTLQMSPMTLSSPRPVGLGETVTSPRSTGDGVPWSNAPLLGWWPTSRRSDPRRREEPPRPLAARRGHQPQALGQPRTRPRRRMALGAT